MVDIEKIKKDYEKILQELSDPGLTSDWTKFEELSKKKKALEQILEKQKEIKEIEKQIEENNSIIAGEEQELISLAESENITLK